MPDVIRTDPVTMRRLYDEHRTAQTAFRRAFVAAYPVGEPITWDRRGVQHGAVLAHGGADRLRVRNRYTKTTYWIRHADVMDAADV